MKHTCMEHFFKHRGFTLVETLMVMVVLGIAAAAIVLLHGNIFMGRDDNRNMQVGVQLMQECAEQILATRRQWGYTAASLASSATATASCAGITLPGFTAPAVTLTAGNSATANMGACPFATGSKCKLVSITQGGLTPVTLMLVSY